MSKHVKIEKSWIGAKNIFFAPVATSNVARYQWVEEQNDDLPPYIHKKLCAQYEAVIIK